MPSIPVVCCKLGCLLGCLVWGGVASADAAKFWVYVAHLAASGSFHTKSGWCTCCSGMSLLTWFWLLHRQLVEVFASTLAPGAGR
jgi:hypothetical protein